MMMALFTYPLTYIYIMLTVDGNTSFRHTHIERERKKKTIISRPEIFRLPKKSSDILNHYQLCKITIPLA